MVPIDGISTGWWGISQALDRPMEHPHRQTVWFLVGSGGMDYGDDYWGSYRGYMGLL